mgnify:CR=1 FL=1
MDDIKPYLIIARNDQRPGDARFFQLNMAALLPGSAISKLLKNTNDLAPRQGSQAGQGRLFSSPKGMGMAIGNASGGIGALLPLSGTKPSCLSA